jgi:hypothetical protein
MPAQLTCGAVQATSHFPATHDHPLGQISPHTPQLLLSELVSVHAAPLRVRPSGQPFAHAPSVHASPAAHE